MNWSNIRQKIIEKYQDKNAAEVEELLWLKKTIKPTESIDWSFVDTVDYNIDSIPRKRELIAEFKLKPKEVTKCHKNLLK